MAFIKGALEASAEEGLSLVELLRDPVGVSKQYGEIVLMIIRAVVNPFGSDAKMLQELVKGIFSEYSQIVATDALVRAKAAGKVFTSIAIGVLATGGTSALFKVLKESQKVRKLLGASKININATANAMKMAKNIAPKIKRYLSKERESVFEYVKETKYSGGEVVCTTTDGYTVSFKKSELTEIEFNSLTNGCKLMATANLKFFYRK